MKIVILDAYAANPGDLSWDEFAALGELTVYDRTAQEDAAARIGDAEVVFINKVRLTDDIFAACPNLKLVSILATGYNIVDLAAAKRRGITVCNVPGYSTRAVVQMTFALLLEICQQVGLHSGAVHTGRWQTCPDFCFWDRPLIELDGKTILSAIEKVSLSDELLEKMRREHELEEAEHEHEHHHHDHEHDEHDEHDHEHEHHHDHDEDDDHDEHDHDDHEHHHHHHDGEECDDPACECHHHHHHHADDVFSSWGKETPKLYSKAALDDILTKLDSGDYGHILRAKGIVNGEGGWLEFDYVPEEHEVRAGHPDYTGRLCVIGAELKEDKLAELFGL